MKKEILKIAITGHVDHGKSTLIGALLLETKTLPSKTMQELKRLSKELGKDAELAYLVDQLKEERENNITIDTTEIFLKSPKREYCIIDTPGHLEFIKNMLTGSSHAEAAILIIDALEGLQEQTRRHAFLLKLLSLKNIIVVINKIDLIDFQQERFLKLQEEIFAFLKKIDLNPVSCIPISAKQGINITKKSSRIKWYQGPTVLGAMEAMQPPQSKDSLPLCFPVQDIYTINDEKVAVGRIASGQLKKNQIISILPENRQAVIAKIWHSFQKEKSIAKSDESIGLILSSDPGIQRGDVFVSGSSALSATQQFQGHVFWLSDTPLKKSGQFHFRCSTQIMPCRITGIAQRIDPSTLEVLETDAKELHQNEIGILNIELDKPCILEEYTGTEELGRYIIEAQDAPQGVGTVVTSGSPSNL